MRLSCIVPHRYLQGNLPTIEQIASSTTASHQILQSHSAPCRATQQTHFIQLNSRWLCHGPSMWRDWKSNPCLIIVLSVMSYLTFELDLFHSVWQLQIFLPLPGLHNSKLDPHQHLGVHWFLGTVCNHLLRCESLAPPTNIGQSRPNQETEFLFIAAEPRWRTDQ